MFSEPFVEKGLLICVSHAFAASSLAAPSRTVISVLAKYYCTRPLPVHFGDAFPWVFICLGLAGCCWHYERSGIVEQMHSKFASDLDIRVQKTI